MPSLVVVERCQVSEATDASVVCAVKSRRSRDFALGVSRLSDHIVIWTVLYFVNFHGYYLIHHKQCLSFIFFPLGGLQ